MHPCKEGVDLLVAFGPTPQNLAHLLLNQAGIALDENPSVREFRATVDGCYVNVDGEEYYIRAQPIESRHTYSNGVHFWDVGRLWKLAQELPVKTIPISQVEHVLDETGWAEPFTSMTVGEVLNHCKRINWVDLRRPIILNSEGRVMDGVHRIAKVILDGGSTIQAVQFEVDPEPDSSAKLPRSPMAEIWGRMAAIREHVFLTELRLGALDNLKPVAVPVPGKEMYLSFETKRLDGLDYRFYARRLDGSRTDIRECDIDGYQLLIDVLPVFDDLVQEVIQMTQIEETRGQLDSVLQTVKKALARLPDEDE